MANHFNTSILLFMQSLSKEIHALPVGIPFEIKIGIVATLFVVSYISHRSYLQSKVSLLENTVDELYRAVAKLESEGEKLRENISDMEIIMENCDRKSEFMFTNLSYLQKALYKKLDLEEKYKDGKKEANLTKNRQQAIQEYLTAEMTVARRFFEV